MSQRTYLRLPICILLTALLTVAAGGPASAQEVEPIAFALDGDTTVAAEEWTIQVPENRSRDDSRVIPLTFVRFASRAESPAAPIVYLAGGPGGSGTGAASGRRWAMIDRLREVADVIALDQRGTGRSDALPACERPRPSMPEGGVTREVFARMHRDALVACMEEWAEQGVDPLGYTTRESADDLEAVRQALGAERLNLLGISYGTHLALAALKRHPERVDRLVLVSAEGLDQTVKLPARHEAFLQRLQASIDASPAARERYPDVRALMARVLDRIDADAPQLTVETRDTTFTETLTRFYAQVMTGGMLGDPGRAAFMLDVYARADDGDYSGFERLMQWFVRPGIRMHMSTLMDVASGISDERLKTVAEQADTALVGDALNAPMPHLHGAVPGLDLGDDFRSPVSSDRPALLFSGTLDGRTFPEAHREIASTLSNSGLVTVENAGHNLFFSHPDVVPMIVAFFEGTAPRNAQRTATAPEWGNR